MGIVRGLDRVKLGLFETRFSYKNYVRPRRGEKDDLDTFDQETNDDIRET